MKKLLALALSICLCLPFATALGAPVDDNAPLYVSDFSGGTDGWFPRSAGGVKLARVSDGLMVIGRAGNWHSPGRAFDLEPGVTYWFSVDVKQTGEDSPEFILSIAHTRDGKESYENLGRAVVHRGEWTTIYGTWTASEYDQYVLYVETANSPMLNFTINNFQALLSDPQKLTVIAYQGELPSLRELYAGSFDFGTCVSQFDMRSTERKELVLRHYSILTPENELKPDAVLDVNASRRLAQEDDTAVAVRFDSAKPILNFARDHGLKVHGHVLVWHSQTPEAFFHVGYDTAAPYVSREVMLTRLDNYIRLVMEYMEENYPGLIVSWDVVNEAVADGSSSLRSSNWTKVVGNDFVNRAFEIADRYAPEGVLLCYNDYSTPYEPKLTGICNLLASLVEDGHIDGYGFQSHYNSGDPTMSAVRKAFERVKAMGLKLRVSELDIAISANNDAARSAQATRYADLMKLYLEYADILEAVQVWGVSDGTSWIGEKYPLLFDASLAPKPAFFAVVDALTE